MSALLLAMLSINLAVSYQKIPSSSIPHGMKRFSFLLFFVQLGFSVGASAQVPTWTDNIACILYTRCTTCHHDGGIAPFSLMTYGEAASAAYGMQQSVNSGSMPPWPPNANYRSFAHERVLTAEEVALINDWVNNGVPEGNGVPPMAPDYSITEAITLPDLVITMPNFTVSTVGNDVYRCFVIPTGLLQNRFISEIEVVPGNREAVHHVLLYQDVSGIPAALDAAAPGPGYTSFGGTGSSASVLIGGWVPGQGHKVYPANMGVQIPAGASIVMQVHYPATSNGQSDQTKVNIKFATGTVREVFIASPLSHGALNEGPLIIPAGQQPTFTSNYLVPAVNITLLDVAAHMHLIGKSIKAWAMTPLGVTIPLIDIPEWDFHWQGFYDYRQPLKIPAGSMLYGTATYDNTTNNPNNPSNPPQLVTVGEATTDEMMLVYFSYAIHFPGDENIIIDTATVVQTHNYCDFRIVGLESNRSLPQFAMAPNPTDGRLRLLLPDGVFPMVRMHDAAGRLVLQQRLLGAELDLNGLADGIYQLTLELEGGSSSQQVVVSH